jgi:hypothetical protein
MPLFLHLFSFIQYVTEQGRSHHTQFTVWWGLSRWTLRVESGVFQRLHHKAVGRLVFLAVLWIRDVYPGSWFLPITYPGSRISDPGSRSKNSNKREGWKKLLSYLFVATNFTKLKIILFLKCWRKKFEPVFKELKNFLPKTLSLSSQKYGFGIRDLEKTYSGSRIRFQGSKRHRILDPGSATLVLAWNRWS